MHTTSETVTMLSGCIIPKSLSQTWREFLLYIQTTVHKAIYDNWFEPLKILKEEEGELWIGIHNIYAEAYIKDNFVSELMQFFGDVSNHTINRLPIIFISDDTTCSTNSQSTANTSIAQITNDVNVPWANPRFTFYNFIIGNYNTFATQLALQVSENPGKIYNPLYIYGKSGSGKTHLLHAIGIHATQLAHQERHVKYITISGFINDIVSHLQNKTLHKFKSEYSQIDVLLIDDIQFLEQKRSFINELCEQIEYLTSRNKQVIITSDVPPNNLSLPPRIIGRLTSGVVSELTTPDEATIAAIIKHKASLQHVVINQETALFITKRVMSRDIRYIEGMVNTLIAKTTFNGRALSIEAVSETMSKEILIQHNDKETIISIIDNVIDTVANHFNISTQAILSVSRRPQYVLARQIAMFLCSDLSPKIKLAIVAESFMKKHSTVINNQKVIKQKLLHDSDLQSHVSHLRARLQKCP